VHLVTINFPDPHLAQPSHRPRRLLNGRLVRLLAETLGDGCEVGDGCAGNAISMGKNWRYF